MIAILLASLRLQSLNKYDVVYCDDVFTMKSAMHGSVEKGPVIWLCYRQPNHTTDFILNGILWEHGDEQVFLALAFCRVGKTIKPIHMNYGWFMIYCPVYSFHIWICKCFMLRISKNCLDVLIRWNGGMRLFNHSLFIIFSLVYSTEWNGIFVVY